MRGEVTVGLNRQLNNQANSLAAAQRAQASMGNLYAVELGNEPDCEYLSCRRFLLCEWGWADAYLLSVYSSSSPIASGTGWSNSIDIRTEASWFTALAPRVSSAGPDAPLRCPS